MEKKDKKISDLQERLDDANENRYGDRQQHSKIGKSEDNKNGKSKNYDKGQNGTSSSNTPDSSDVDRTRQEEECDGKTPQAAITATESDKFFKDIDNHYDEGSRGRKVLTDFLGDAELEAIMTDGYNAYNFLDGQLSIDHLHCMAHCRAKFIKAHKLGMVLMAKEVIEPFDELYRTNGGYPIDNNIAERQVRPFAAMRKVIEHFGSD